MSNRIPQADHNPTEEAPAHVPTQRRPRRTRAEPKLYITFLPEGKGGPREEKGSVPLEVGFEDHIEERSDCEPGLYRIEKKRSGEFSGEVMFYTKEEPDERNTVDDAGGRDHFEGFEAAGAPSADIARAVNAALDAHDRRQRNGQPDPMEQFRQMRELLKEEREEMERRFQEQAAKQQPRDSLSDFERFIELQKKLAPEQTSRDELSPDDRAQLMLVQKSGLIPEFMKSMREMLRAPEAAAEPEGLGPSLLQFAKELLPHVGPSIGPVLGQKLNELLSRVDVGSLAQKINGGQSAASPGAQSAVPADARMAAFAHLMRRVVTDLVDNVSPDVAVNATLQFVNAYPELAAQVGQIVNATPADVAAFILAQTREDVRTLPHCDQWIASYQSKLRTSDANGPASDRECEADNDDGPLTLEDVLQFVKQQIIEDQDPAAAVSSVLQLLAEQPELAPTINQLLASSNAELVKTLSQATQTNLTIIANAESFIEKLKDGIKARLKVAVAVSSNGHKASAKTEDAKVS